MKYAIDAMVQRGHNFAIVDEVDSILIDEARTPLIISGPSEESTDLYGQAASVIPRLKRETDYTVDEKSRTAALTEEGVEQCEKALHLENLYAPSNMSINHAVQQALRAIAQAEYSLEQLGRNTVDPATGKIRSVAVKTMKSMLCAKPQPF